MWCPVQVGAARLRAGCPLAQLHVWSASHLLLGVKMLAGDWCGVAVDTTPRRSVEPGTRPPQIAFEISIERERLHAAETQTLSARDLLLTTLALANPYFSLAEKDGGRRGQTSYSYHRRYRLSRAILSISLFTSHHQHFILYFSFISCSSSSYILLLYPNITIKYYYSTLSFITIFPPLKKQ